MWGGVRVGEVGCRVGCESGGVLKGSGVDEIDQLLDGGQPSVVSFTNRRACQIALLEYAEAVHNKAGTCLAGRTVCCAPNTPSVCPSQGPCQGLPLASC